MKLKQMINQELSAQRSVLKVLKTLKVWYKMHIERDKSQRQNYELGLERLNEKQREKLMNLERGLYKCIKKAIPNE